MLMKVLYIVAGVLGGVLMAMKVVVPYLHSPRLEAVEKRLEELEALLTQVAPAPASPAAPAPPTV